jgi:site-specific recombinase XerD
MSDYIAGSLCLGDAVRLFLDARVGIVAEKTLRLNTQALKSLIAFFGVERCLDSLTLHDLRAWRKFLIEKNCKYGGDGLRPVEQKPLAPHTIHGHIRVAKQFFAWLAREEILLSNPAVRLEQIPLRHTITTAKMITDDDFAKMLAVAGGESPARIRDRALLWWFRQTGSRLGGALTLTLDALDLEHGRALVIEKGKGGGKARTVFLKQEAVDALREWLDMRACLPQLCDRVFVTVPNDAGLGGGTPLSDKALYLALSNLAKRAGVKGRYNPHAFRHALAKRMLTNGANLAAVSKVLGHADIRVTHEHYGQYEDAEAQRAHSQFA